MSKMYYSTDRIDEDVYLFMEFSITSVAHTDANL